MNVDSDHSPFRQRFGMLDQRAKTRPFTFWTRLHPEISFVQDIDALNGSAAVYPSKGTIISFKNKTRTVQAVVATAVMINLLHWIDKRDSYDLWDALGICGWVCTVLGALSAVSRYCERFSSRVWLQITILALTAGIASSMANLVLALVVENLPSLFPEGLRRLGFSSWREAALISFFDGDALFGFWALLVEIPRRIAANQALVQERREIQQEAELLRIRAALEPHFMMNTLNAISGLVAEEPREARELIAALGDLLRDATEAAHQKERSIAEEVAWLQRFARIMESRHRHRLSFAWSVHSRVEHEPMPALLLQPLVENAVYHGALARSDGGHVAVKIDCAGHELRFRVCDNGPGLSPDGPRPGARGLELVRRRLALESKHASLELSSNREGTCALVRLPRPRL